MGLSSSYLTSDTHGRVFDRAQFNSYVFRLRYHSLSHPRYRFPRRQQCSADMQYAHERNLAVPRGRDDVVGQEVSIGRT